MAEVKENNKEDSKEQAEEVVDNSKSKSNILIFVLIFLIVVLAILIIVYMFVILPKKEAGDQAVVNQVSEMPTEPQPTGDAFSNVAGSIDMSVNNGEIGQIYPIPTMNVNLADPTGITYLSITLALEFNPKNTNLYNEIEAKMPRISDMIITVLSSKSYEEISTSQGKANLKIEFLRRVNAMLSKGRVYSVYITSFVVQKG